MQISKVQFRNNPIDSSFYNKQQISKTRIMTLPQDSFVLQKTANSEPAKINFKANSPVSNIIAQMLKSMAYKRSIKGSKRPYSTLYKELKDITQEIQIPVSKTESINAFDINPNKSNKYIIFLHGFSHNITSNQQLYQSIAKSDYGILAIDYRGYGKNNPSKHIKENNIQEDIMSSIQYLKDKNINEIGIIGHSFGAYLAAKISNTQKIAFQILVAPLTSLEFWLRNVLKHPKKYETEMALIKYIPGLKKQYSKIFNIKKYLVENYTPTYIVQAKHDRYIKCARVNILSKSIPNLKNYIIIPTGGHRMDEPKIEKITDIVKNL